VEGAAAEIAAASGRRVIPVIADVTKPDQVRRAVDAVLAAFGRIDVLVNGLGDSIRKPLVTLPDNADSAAGVSDDELRFIMDINLTEALLCTRAVGPHMLARRSGKVINIASWTAHQGGRDHQTVGGIEFGVKRGVEEEALKLAGGWRRWVQAVQGLGRERRQDGDERASVAHAGDPEMEVFPVVEFPPAPEPPVRLEDRAACLLRGQHMARLLHVGIAAAFGFAVIAMVYAIGKVSGCNINPAVTLGFVLTRKMTWGRAVFYWVGQLLGAAIGGLIIYAIANNIDGFSSKNNFAQNGWGQYSPGGYGIVAAMFVEVVFTALLVYVVLSTTNARFPVGFGGLAAGLTLALIHMVTIPVDNTSVNPARSFGSAIFAGTNALSQLWLFIVFPLIGGAVGALVWLMIDETRLEDTMFAEVPGATGLRDAADKLDDKLD
jgi:aquaporin Z